MVEITPYELLSHAVIRLAAKDILEGYKKVYKKYGRSVLDINNWERKKSKFSKRPCFIFNNQYHYEGTLMGNLGSALCFLYSSQFEMFCRLNPDVVVNHIHMLYIQDPTAKIAENYNIMHGDVYLPKKKGPDVQPYIYYMPGKVHFR